MQKRVVIARRSPISRPQAARLTPCRTPQTRLGSDKLSGKFGRAVRCRNATGISCSLGEAELTVRENFEVNWVCLASRWSSATVAKPASIVSRAAWRVSRVILLEQIWGHGSWRIARYLACANWQIMHPSDIIPPTSLGNRLCLRHCSRPSSTPPARAPTSSRARA